MILARAGWRGILATDGEPSVVRNMRYNVNANRLGHAARCLELDWSDAAPKKVDLASVGLCIGSDLVYHDRPHRELAATLRRVLAARPAGGATPRVLLVLTLR